MIPKTNATGQYKPSKASTAIFLY
uniref:Uncharacterized protein n=1 Tax=Arundo donax TaxID=35708 RepID=A0A0A9A5Z5_ARUDO